MKINNLCWKLLWLSSACWSVNTTTVQLWFLTTNRFWSNSLSHLTDFAVISDIFPIISLIHQPSTASLTVLLDVLSLVFLFMSCMFRRTICLTVVHSSVIAVHAVRDQRVNKTRINSLSFNSRFRNSDDYFPMTDQVLPGFYLKKMWQAFFHFTLHVFVGLGSGQRTNKQSNGASLQISISSEVTIQLEVSNALVFNNMTLHGT